MRTPSKTSFARRSIGIYARLLGDAQGSLRKFASLAFVGGVSVVALVSAPHAAPDSWIQKLGSASGNEAAPHAGLPSAIAESAQYLPANAGPVVPDKDLSSAEPFHYNGKAIDRSRAVECLAAAAWYEAGDDPVGQRAVIQTVINRVNHPSFPNSVCAVVFEGSQLPTGCQFTFTCDGSLKRRQPSFAAWKRASLLSEQALNGAVDDSVGTATHYHASYVAPWWSRKLERLASVGPHIFYRWAGDRGAYRQQGHLSAERDYKTLVAESLERSNRAELVATHPEDRLSNGVRPAMPGTVAEPATVPSGRAIFMPVKEGEASGRWALAAMKSCKGRTDCQVLGYDEGEDIRRNQARAAPERDRPVFLFIRDAASAMTVALWDCQRIKRPNESECLPIDKRALTKLMRDRPRLD